MLSLRQGLGLNTIKTVGAAFENLYSLSFDGVDDHVTIPYDTSYTPTAGGWSISFWTKLTTKNRRILSKYTALSPEWSVGNNRITGYASIQFFLGGVTSNWQRFVANVDITDGAWHHVIFTFDGTGGTNSIIGYIDGTKYSTVIGNGTFVNAGSFSPVTQSTTPITFAEYSSVFTVCNMDEVSIFDSVLSDATALDMYNSGNPTDLTGATNLQSWWRNGDTAGTSVYPTIEDYGTVGNNGTMTNMASGDIVTDVP